MPRVVSLSAESFIPTSLRPGAPARSRVWLVFVRPDRSGRTAALRSRSLRPPPHGRRSPERCQVPLPFSERLGLPASTRAVLAVRALSGASPRAGVPTRGSAGTEVHPSFGGCHRSASLLHTPGPGLQSPRLRPGAREPPLGTSILRGVASPPHGARARREAPSPPACLHPSRPHAPTRWRDGRKCTEPPGWPRLRCG